MAQVTSLSVTGVPGRLHSFSAKAAAGGESRGADRFTALTAMALPGRLSAFTPKGGAGAGKGADRITVLSVSALPGVLHSFAPKTAPVPPTPVASVQGQPYYKLHGFNRMRLFKPR